MPKLSKYKELKRLIGDMVTEMAMDDSKAAELIELLSSALGLSVAVACAGDQKGIQEIMTGAEEHAFDTAVKTSNKIKVMLAK